MIKGKKTKNIKVAPIKRLVAYGIDWYLSALCMSLAVVVITSINQHDLIVENILSNLPNELALLALILGMLLTILYFLIPELLMKEKHQGQTFGKMVMKIKVVSYDDSPATLKALFIRYFIGLIVIEQTLNSASFSLRTFVSMISSNEVSQCIYYIGLSITFLSLVLMFIRPEGKMLHDIIAKTKVVEVE